MLTDLGTSWKCLRDRYENRALTSACSLWYPSFPFFDLIPIAQWGNFAKEKGTNTIRANLIMKTFVMSPQRKTEKMLYRLKYHTASKIGKSGWCIISQTSKNSASAIQGSFPGWKWYDSVHFTDALEHESYWIVIICTFPMPSSLPCLQMRFKWNLERIQTKSSWQNRSTP